MQLAFKSLHVTLGIASLAKRSHAASSESRGREIDSGLNGSIRSVMWHWFLGKGRRVIVHIIYLQLSSGKTKKWEQQWRRPCRSAYWSWLAVAKATWSRQGCFDRCYVVVAWTLGTEELRKSHLVLPPSGSQSLSPALSISVFQSGSHLASLFIWAPVLILYQSIFINLLLLQKVLSYWGEDRR